jgi:hypothetical protein
MDNRKKIVTQLPLSKLWTDEGDIDAERTRHLTDKNIQEILSASPVDFVIADIGLKLQWISLDQSFDFWKNELKPHLVNGMDGFQLDKFPGNYAYIASEWSGEHPTKIILLEKYH